MLATGVLGSNVLNSIEKPVYVVSHGPAGIRPHNQYEQVTVAAGRAVMGNKLPDGLRQLTVRCFRERECVLHLDGKCGTTHRPHAEIIDSVFSLAIDSRKRPRPQALNWRGGRAGKHGDPEPRRYPVLEVEPASTRTSPRLCGRHLLPQATDPFIRPHRCEQLAWAA
jgi:hypothetical protein